MKKNLLTIGLLAASLSASAQLGYVGDTALMYVGQGALVYNGGDLKVAGTGTVENHGNFMIDQGGFATDKTDGSNFTLTLDDKTSFAQYGQLWINNTSQSAVTGTVTKQYSDTYHGQYEQTALPFVGKLFSTLNNEIKGAGFTDVRFIGGKASVQNILGWNNKVVRDDLFTLASSTTDPAQYYVLGAKNLATTYFPSTVSLITGIPSASGVSKTLSGAGAGINFGANGTGLNYYRQRYNTYVFDAWDASTPWTGTYGKNTYQFGNPYLTNLDLTLLPTATKSVIKGISYAASGSSTNLASTPTLSYMNFTSSGATVGDVAPIIKPMQEFSIKLVDGSSSPVINFDALRTFSFTPSNYSYTNTGNSAKSASAKNALAMSNGSDASASSSVKQLDVIALDANKNEIGRTYYAVYADAHTGAYTGYTAQAAAKSSNIIGTFEEKPEGGIDTNVQNTYWLYINEANENDFKGKRVPLALFSDKIAYLKFNIRENMQKIPAQTSAVSTGESFYVNADGTPTELTQDLIIPVPASSINKNDGIGLYYGKPTDATVLATTIASQKPSDTFVAWDDTAKDYKIVFDPAWKTADIQIFDLAGRLVSEENKVPADATHTLKVPVAQGSYIVHAKSEAGALFVQKILKN